MEIPAHVFSKLIDGGELEGVLKGLSEDDPFPGRVYLELKALVDADNTRSPSHMVAQAQEFAEVASSGTDMFTAIPGLKIHHTHTVMGAVIVGGTARAIMEALKLASVDSASIALE